MRPVSFAIEKRLPRADGNAGLGRAGVVTTPHGVIRTPAFVTVGTAATVKSLTVEQVSDCGAQVVLANTYHLYLRPGDELVRDAGGLHSFMNWRGPTMTDSGGFQVFSLGSGFGTGLNKFSANRPQTEGGEGARGGAPARPLAKIDEDGVTFKSPYDGGEHRFTPERSIEIQHNIGADIIFSFDECTAPDASEAYQREAMERTHRWAARGLAFHRANDEQAGRQGLFGIVQGGKFTDLRKQSATVVAGMDFDGYGIGGSYTKEGLAEVLGMVNAILPEDKPRHLLGIGEPEDLLIGIAHGIDTFDCVSPTRLGRTGVLYTRQGKINMFNAAHRRDLSAPDRDCSCYTCRNYTRSYLSHLFRANEMLAATLASIHNLYFIITLVDRAREAILEDSFVPFCDNFLTQYRSMAAVDPIG